jgi:hypothetical protein
MSTSSKKHPGADAKLIASKDLLVYTCICGQMPSSHNWLFQRKDTMSMSVHPGRFVTANGVNIYYEEHGQGPPLLLIHGGTITASIDTVCQTIK